MDKDFQAFVLQLFYYGTISLTVIVIGLVIVAATAYLSRNEAHAREFGLLVERAGALKLIAFFTLSIAVTLLSITGKLSSDSVMAFFGAMLGFILGRADYSSFSRKNTNNTD